MSLFIPSMMMMMFVTKKMFVFFGFIYAGCHICAQTKRGRVICRFAVVVVAVCAARWTTRGTACAATWCARSKRRIDGGRARHGVRVARRCRIVHKKVAAYRKHSAIARVASHWRRSRKYWNGVVSRVIVCVHEKQIGLI